MIMRLMRLLEKFIKVKKSMINNLVDNFTYYLLFDCFCRNDLDKINVGGTYEKSKNFSIGSSLIAAGIEIKLRTTGMPRP